METAIATSVKKEVLHYIQHHLNGNLSLETLAKFSGYSGFYLHRLMRKELGEPIGNYIKRKRIESAAMLLGLTDYPASTIKDLVGYENSAAFSKAFLQVMGCSPRDFRKKNFFKNTYAQLPEEYVSLDYKIVRMNDWQVIAFPAIRNYFDKSLFTCWQPVKDFLTNSGINTTNLQYWGVLHECPNLTGRTDCRYDAALSLASGVAPKDLFNTQYAGGKFVVFKFCAPYACLKDISLKISNYILNHTKLEFREGCSFLRYLQNPITASPDYLLTEWYLPVK